MNRRAQLHRTGGFSLVELMVSLVIGLLALTFATRLVLIGERNKEASLGGSDSMQNGMLALFSITSDASQAGFGINADSLVGCDLGTNFRDTSGFALASATRGGSTIYPLAAAIIQPNTSGSDQLSLYSGSSPTGTGSLKIDSQAGGTINISAVPYGFQLNDVVVATTTRADNAQRCSLSQITTDPSLQALPPTQQTFQIGGSGRFAGALGMTFSGEARVFNLGQATNLALHTWSVSDGFLRLRATNLAGASAASATVVDNVVALKAQYGFDTRAVFDTANGLQVSEWKAVMVDADHDGVIGSRLDYGRIAALRIAVVARSKAPERPLAGAACTATTVQPVVFDSASPSTVAAVPITVTVAVTGDPVDWKCYRYRVFETIVPIRNAGWRPN